MHSNLKKYHRRWWRRRLQKLIAKILSHRHVCECECACMYGQFVFYWSDATIIASEKETENGQPNDSDRCNYSNSLLNCVMQWKNIHIHSSYARLFGTRLLLYLCVCVRCSMHTLRAVSYLQTHKQTHTFCTLQSAYSCLVNCESRIWNSVSLSCWNYILHSILTFCAQHPFVRLFVRSSARSLVHSLVLLFCALFICSFHRLRFAPCFLLLLRSSNSTNVYHHYQHHHCWTFVYIFHSQNTELPSTTRYSVSNAVYIVVYCLVVQDQCCTMANIVEMGTSVSVYIVLLFWMVHNNNQIYILTCVPRALYAKGETKKNFGHFRKSPSPSVADRKE